MCFSGGWFTLAAGMNWQDWLRFSFNWLGLPMLALLAGVMIYRRWYRIYSFFLIYVITAEAVGVIRLAALKSASYDQIYWISDTLLAAAAFLATYELFFKRLFPVFYRVPFYRLLFPTAAILITLAAVLNALLGGHYSFLGTMIHAYEFLRGVTLFCFVLLMLVMGRTWDRQEFGIAAGFGLDIAMSLMLVATWTHTSLRSAILATWSVIAYDLACLVWLYCFWRAPKVEGSQSSPSLPPDALRQAKNWEDSLKDFISPGKR